MHVREEAEGAGGGGDEGTGGQVSKFAFKIWLKFRPCPSFKRGYTLQVASPLSYQIFFQLLKERGKERRRHKGESAASGRWKEGEEGEAGGEEGEGGEGELLIDLFFFFSSYFSSYFTPSSASASK